MVLGPCSHSGLDDVLQHRADGLLDRSRPAAAAAAGSRRALLLHFLGLLHGHVDHLSDGVENVVQ